MRNTFKFGLFAALATFSLACTKATVEPTVGGDEKVQMTFTATSGAVTKTYLDGKTVKWHENDVIGIHDGYSEAKDATLNQQFTISTINPDGSATFTGTAAAGKEVYYATYPYDVNNFITEEGKMRIAFTTAQTTSRPETFDQKFNPSAAMLKDGVFTFKNLGGLLKFTLTNDNVKKVTVTANDKGTVGGVYYIYFDENGLPKQMGGNIQVLAADLQLNITTPWLNLDNSIVYQHSSSAALPLPTLTMYNNLYYPGSTKVS